MSKKTRRSNAEAALENDTSESGESSLKERITDAAAPLLNTLEKPVARVSVLVKWVKNVRPYRVYMNFSHNDGNLRAAGMAFQSLFAVFAALWVGFSIAGIRLRNAPEVFEALVEIINRAIPNLIASGDSPGVIKVTQLEEATGFGWGGIIAAIGLLWTAIAWLFYTRQAVRAVFGLSRDTTNYVLQKINDLFFGLGFGLLLVISAMVTIASTQAISFLLQLINVDSHSFWTYALTQVIGVIVSVSVNIVTLGMMFRVMSRVQIPWRNLFTGSLLGACVLAALSALGGAVLGGASKNPLLATFTVFIGLLIWFNLVSRVILLSASWIAIGMKDSGISPRVISAEEQAAEDAAEEYDARVLVARANLEDARETFAAASLLGKIRAQRHVARAERELNSILDEGLQTSTRL